MERRAAVALATLTTLAATACGSGSSGLDDLSALAARAGADTSAPAALAVGQCLAGARVRENPDALAAALARYGIGAFEALGDDPAWTDPVDCGEPHRLEVYGVVGLPPQVESEVASYADVVNVDSHVYREVSDEVTRGCALSFGPAAAAARPAPLAVDVTPAWSAGAGVSVTWAPSPAVSWDGGEHLFACLFEQARPGTVRLADVASDDFPSAARSCLMGTAFVPCGQRHDAERIAMVGLDRAVAEGQIVGARAVDDDGRVDLGSDAWQALDGVCERYLDAVAPHHAAGLRGVANTYPELYPDAEGRYTVLCSAQAPFRVGPSGAVVTVGSVFGR
jgi:hypothetical protein